MKENKSTVSIIIPVYNAENYLTRCLDSLLLQSFSSWECVLVNDGSSDTSGLICDHYAALDPRFHVLHKQNNGVSSARNDGIQKTTAEWICFLDADDFIEPNFLLNLLEFNKNPLVVGGFKRFGDKHDESIPQKGRVCNIEKELEIEWGLPLKGFLFWYVWGKLFRRDIINKFHISFNTSMKYSEDFCFVLDYMSHIDMFAYVSHSDYMHAFDRCGPSKYKMDFDTFQCHVDIQEAALSKIELKNSHRYSKIRNNVYGRFYKRYLYNLLSLNNYREFRIESSKYTHRYNYQWTNNNCDGRKLRICTCLLYNFSIFVFVFRRFFKDTLFI